MDFQKLLNPAARFLLAFIFVASDGGKVFAFDATAALMSSVGFPMPRLFLVGAIVIEIVGGLGLMLGIGTRYAAAALILFVIPATLMFHASLIADPVAGQEQAAHTLKNTAIIGGLLKFLADGGGSYSIDDRARRREILV